jgi:carotenoid cleavage dioxygenase-like enzyme
MNWSGVGFSLAVSNLINSFDHMALHNRHDNPYLQGNYAPVLDEHVNAPTTIISGVIPDDVEGLFLRIGPNPIAHHVSRGYHWFDGHGMVHGMRVAQGRATYSNQWIRTPNYRLSRQYDQPIFPQIGELHGFIGLLKAAILFPLMRMTMQVPPQEEGTANTVLYLYNNRLFAGQEASVPFELQWQWNNSLRSIGFERFSGKMKMDYPATAHAKKDPEDGRLYFHSYSAQPTLPAMKFVKVFKNNVESSFSISSPVRSFVHDMAITNEFVVLVESSNAFDIKKIWSGEFLGFDNHHKLRIGVVPKTAQNESEIEWFEFDKPYGIIHTANAWEVVNGNNEKEIVLTAPASTNFSGFNARRPDSLNHNWLLTEFRMNLATKKSKIIEFGLLSESVEFPNVHPAFLGRKVRYGFASVFSQAQNGFTGLVKFDMSNRSTAGKINMPVGYSCGEAILIPKKRKLSSLGDAVYLAVFATHDESLVTEWILYDGETMSSEPMVRVGLNGIRVPNGFHGLWIDESDLLAHQSHNHPL